MPMPQSKIWTEDKQHEYDLQQYANEIYREIYGHLLATNRSDGGIIRLTKPGDIKPHVLDQFFGIDAVLKFKNGMILTVQEKFRRIDKIHFGDFTLEAKSNNRGAEGELEHLMSDIYLYGYGERDQGFALAYLFKTHDVKMDIIEGRLVGTPGMNKERSTASFMGYKWDDFNPNHFIHIKNNY